MTASISLPYWHVNAFTNGPRSGNPAGVVVLDRQVPEPLQERFAAEAGLPAVAFVGPVPQQGPIPIRWLSSHGEIELCGHGALAAAFVLLERGAAEPLRFVTRRGVEFQARRSAGGVSCELALPALPSNALDLPDLVAALGAEPQELRWNDAGYVLAVFATAAQVRALEPDLAALAALGNWQVTATAPAAPGDSGVDVVSRVFRPGGEDAATGSAHAVLAPYWCARLGQAQLVALQASWRGALISCRLDGERVWIGGKCETVVEERAYLSG